MTPEQEHAIHYARIKRETGIRIRHRRPKRQLRVVRRFHPLRSNRNPAYQPYQRSPVTPQQLLRAIHYLARQASRETHAGGASPSVGESPSPSAQPSQP